MPVRNLEATPQASTVKEAGNRPRRAVKLDPKASWGAPDHMLPNTIFARL